MWSINIIIEYKSLVTLQIISLIDILLEQQQNDILNRKQNCKSIIFI